MAIVTTVRKIDQKEQEVTQGETVVGPFSDTSISQIERKMEKHSVFAYREECVVLREIGDDGAIWLKVSSDLSTGYLLGRDSTEAETTDVDLFILDVLNEGECLTVKGHYPDGMGGVITSHARYGHIDGVVLADVEREGVKSDGKVTPICFRNDLKAHESKQKFPWGDNIVCLSTFRRGKAR